MSIDNSLLRRILSLLNSVSEGSCHADLVESGRGTFHRNAQYNPFLKRRQPGANTDGVVY